MRYLFKGMLRNTGKPVEGHVYAHSSEAAAQMVAENGIACESLREDPKPDPSALPPAPAYTGEDAEVASAIDSALDSSTTQVNVDDLAKRYRGQRVRVIDRDKIRNNVMSVITTAIKQSSAGQDSQNQTLERVEQALTKMFGDNQNLTSELSPQQAALEDQIGRLGNVVLRLEKQLAQLNMAVRRGGYGGGAASGKLVKRVRDPKNDQVLLEIFETNLELQRKMKKTEPSKTPDP